jgi:hypothetical protein
MKSKLRKLISLCDRARDLIVLTLLLPVFLTLAVGAVLGLWLLWCYLVVRGGYVSINREGLRKLELAVTGAAEKVERGYTIDG